MLLAGALLADPALAGNPALAVKEKAAARAAAPAAPRFTPCQLEHPLRIAAFAADCATVAVPEDRAARAGRRVPLRVARIAAISRRKLPDPLFVISGGPGQAATDFYAAAAPAFARILRERDIVLVDQRGTGGSNALDCEQYDDALFDEPLDEIRGIVERCRSELEKRADLRQYTTSVAVRDLDEVRARLGYARINLYGVSYGTRVAQHYARRYPDRTRALILDGVVSPQLILGPALALDAERSLERILARCVADRDCRAAFTDPAADYRALRASLSVHAVDVRVPNPSTGAMENMAFSSQHLATVLRLASYSAESAALLPLGLQRARRDGDFSLLAAQFLLTQRSLEDALAFGMHNSVVCSEDVPLIDEAKVDRSALAATYIGVAQLEGLQTICALWPRGVVDADFHAPLASRAPTLLLSGSDDPVTPPAYATQAAKGFVDSKHIVLPGFGHGQLGAPCIDRVMSAFLDTGTTRGLDVSCTKDVKPMPFFTSLAGPAP